jgi:streptomycin 6-kinase
VASLGDRPIKYLILAALKNDDGDVVKTESRLLHGDVTIRNVGVYRYRPITVGLFDPKPMSGDSSWDIAPMMNNVAFNELRDRRESLACIAMRRTPLTLKSPTSSSAHS